jgi:uncharacterized membrane protein YedE/YeeE
MSILAPILVGFAFGFLLQKSGMTKYHKIANAFRFTDMAVLKFMMSALVTGMIGIYGLKALGWAAIIPVTPTYLVGNVVGGMIFGVGMALSGVCAAPVAAGGGEGRLDYLIPGALGMLVGGTIFGLAYPSFFPQLSQLANYGAVSLMELWNLNTWLFVGLFTVIALLLFYLIDRAGLQRKEKIV